MVGIVGMDDHGQGIDRRLGYQHFQLDQVRCAIAVKLIVHRGIAARAALQLVVEIDDHFGQRQVIVHHNAAGRRMLLLDELPAALACQVHNRAVELFRCKNLDSHPGFANLGNGGLVRQIGRTFDQA